MKKAALDIFSQGLVLVLVMVHGTAAARSMFQMHQRRATEDTPPAELPPVIKTLCPCENITVTKVIETPPIKPDLDVCFLVDETGSFNNDADSISENSAEIFDRIEEVADAHFAVAGFRDYPNEMDNVEDPLRRLAKDIDERGGVCGGIFLYPYCLHSGMSPQKNVFLEGIDSLYHHSGGWDAEAQFDAIVYSIAIDGSPVMPDGAGDNCGWRSSSSIHRVLLLATDALFHVPVPGTSYPWENDFPDALQYLQDNKIKLVGLKGPDPGADPKLDALASLTGGSTIMLPANAEDIADLVTSGLENKMSRVVPVPQACTGLAFIFHPKWRTVPSGTDAHFEETIIVTHTAELESTITCKVQFKDFYADENVLAEQDITIHIGELRLDAYPSSATNEIGEDQEHSVFAKVTICDSIPVEDKPIHFEITEGPNMGISLDDTTDSMGEAVFQYQSSGGCGSAGVDTIHVCLFPNKPGHEKCEDVEKQWQDTKAPLVICMPSYNLDTREGKSFKESRKNSWAKSNAWLIIGFDDTDKNVSLRVFDKKTKTSYGHLTSGTQIKYKGNRDKKGRTKVHADDGQKGEPENEMHGVVSIEGKGSAKLELHAIDCFGNSASVKCASSLSHNAFN